MNPEGIAQPHDRLVKQVFGRKETAARFLQAYLPRALAASLKWSALELCPGSFVDAKLRHKESDLLFRVPISRAKERPHGETMFLYCLFEHQRKVDNWMMLRLLAYMVQIWQGLIRNDSSLKHLPAILPIVLYQGPKKWNAAVDFHEHLALPVDSSMVVGRYQPAFEHLLVDLSQIKAEELRGDLICKLTLGLLKAVAEGKAMSWLERGGPLLGELLQERKATGIVETLLRYLLAADNDVTLRAVQQVLTKLAEAPATATRNRIMSIAEQIRKEGRREGREEGRQEGTLIGQVQLMQELLGLRVTPAAALSAKSANDLRSLAAELRQRLRQKIDA